MVRCVFLKPGQALPRPHRPASALAHIAAELLNFACNSPATISNIEFTALKSQRFQTLLNLHPIELHATFEEAQAPPAHGYRSQALRTPMWSGLSCWAFGVLWCVLLQTSSIRGVFRVDFYVVVTNVVNPRAFSLKMVVFGLRLTTFVTGVLVRRFELRWFDDVCNVGRPLVARPGPAIARGHHKSLA